MYRMVRTALGGGLVVLLIALVPLVAEAHEGRELGGGQYEVEIGFIDEPAYVNQKNGLFLRVVTPAESGVAVTPAAGGDAHGGGTPVEGLAGTLQAQVMFGDQTMDLPLIPAFDDPGVYTSVFFPTAAGDYTYRITGAIAGIQIDESFTSSPEGFASVEPIEPLQFPKQPSSRAGDGMAAATVGGGSGGDAGGPNLPVGVVSLVLAAGVGLWLAWKTTIRGRRTVAPTVARG